MSDNSLNVSRGGRSNWLLFNKVLLKVVLSSPNEDHGLSFHGFISLHWVLNICCYKRVSYQATQVKERVIWCKWNPTTVTTTQRAHPGERESVMPSTQKRTMDGKARAHVWHFSHEIHTLLLCRALWLVVYEWSTEMVDREPEVLLNEQHKNR